MEKTMTIIITVILSITFIVSSCKKNSTQQIAPIITGFSPTFDTAGGIVTIVGTGFTGTKAVSFGGVPAASFNLINDDSITAIVGLGGSGKVAVVTPGGTATYNGFEYPLIYCDCISSDSIATANLIAHWRFDSSDIESISQLGPVNSGGAFNYVAGRIGKAISFTNGWLTYPAAATWAGTVNSTPGSNDTLQNGFTITLWAHLPAPSTAISADSLLTNLFQLSSYINSPNWPVAGISVSKFADSTLLLIGGLTNTDNSGNHQSADSAYLRSVLIDTLQWTFIALVYDTTGHQFQYYFNNVYVGQATLITGNVSGSVFPTSETLHIPAPNYATIGAFESSATFPASTDVLPLPSFMTPGLTGELDDIRMFNISLTQQNINDLYMLGSLSK
jgi:hypothetical protein